MKISFKYLFYFAVLSVPLIFGSAKTYQWYVEIYQTGPFVKELIEVFLFFYLLLFAIPILGTLPLLYYGNAKLRTISWIFVAIGLSNLAALVFLFFADKIRIV